jgi:hypothetical protein
VVAVRQVREWMNKPSCPGQAHRSSDALVSQLIIVCPAGVGITGELPGDEEGQDAASSQGPSDQTDTWQDPTERLALALGLQVSQLAHMTGRIPGNPDGPLHRLRYIHTIYGGLVWLVQADSGMNAFQTIDTSLL